MRQRRPPIPQRDPPGAGSAPPHERRESRAHRSRVTVGRIAATLLLVAAWAVGPLLAFGMLLAGAFTGGNDTAPLLLTGGGAALGTIGVSALIGFVVRSWQWALAIVILLGAIAIFSAPVVLFIGRGLEAYVGLGLIAVVLIVPLGVVPLCAGTSVGCRFSPSPRSWPGRMGGDEVNDRNRRKALLADYKENPPDAGVYRFINTATGKSLIGSSANLHGMLGKLTFAQKVGSPSALDRRLHPDAKTHGIDTVEFEVLETLDPAASPSAAALREDLATLEALWREKYDPSELY